MAKRTSEGEHIMVPPEDLQWHPPRETQKDEPMPAAEPEPSAEQTPAKDESLPQEKAARAAPDDMSECPTATSTAELSPELKALARSPLSPEARKQAHECPYGHLHVHELKERLTKMGVDFTGVTEKSELIMLLEQLDVTHDPKKLVEVEL